jgi:hypothetical protein
MNQPRRPEVGPLNRRRRTQEETTIELFTWDRHTSSFAQTSSSEIEQNIENTDNTKDTTLVSNELTKDSNFKQMRMSMPTSRWQSRRSDLSEYSSKRSGRCRMSIT